MNEITIGEMLTDAIRYWEPGRIAYNAVLVAIVVTIFAPHWPYGFFINWNGNQKGEGFEFHLLALGIAITPMIIGAGTWSLDSAPA